MHATTFIVSSSILTPHIGGNENELGSNRGLPSVFKRFISWFLVVYLAYWGPKGPFVVQDGIHYAWSQASIVSP